MLGYNEMANQDLSLGDPFKGGRKLRPLVPRPYLSPPHHSVNTACLTAFHNPTHHLLSLNSTTRNQHHFMGAEEGKEVVGAQQVMVSSRWNPTPEQLRALEELYRRGTRTPSAEQIQHITAQLRRYGKIEGKNVFYWFQNHKARERQKRRRQLQLPLPPSSGSSAVGNRIGYEAEQKNCKWAPSSKNKDESEPPIQIGEAGVTKADATSNTSDGWIQFHEVTEFQHNHNTNNNINIIASGRNVLFAGERNSTWQAQNNIMVQPSSCSSCCYCCPTPPPPLPFPPHSSKLTVKDLNLQTSLDNKQPNNGAAGFGLGERRPSSPSTLQLFPVGARDEDGGGDHHMTNEEEEEEEDNVEDNSCVTNINSNDEKLASRGGSILNERIMCNNNPFPYYQFL